MLIESKEDWEKIEDMVSPWRIVDLFIDGYIVTITQKFISKTNTAFMLFVDGEFRGEWGFDDCDIRRRFFYRREKYLYSAKNRNFLRKLQKKSKYLNLNIDEKFVSYSPFFPSFRALKKHLIRNNQCIQWCIDDCA